MSSNGLSKTQLDHLNALAKESLKPGSKLDPDERTGHPATLRALVDRGLAKKANGKWFSISRKGGAVVAEPEKAQKQKRLKLKLKPAQKMRFPGFTDEEVATDEKPNSAVDPVPEGWQGLIMDNGPAGYLTYLGGDVGTLYKTAFDVRAVDMPNGSIDGLTIRDSRILPEAPKHQRWGIDFLGPDWVPQLDASSRHTKDAIGYTCYHCNHSAPSVDAALEHEVRCTGRPDAPKLNAVQQAIVEALETNGGTLACIQVAAFAGLDGFEGQWIAAKELQHLIVSGMVEREGRSYRLKKVPGSSGE